MEFDEIDEEEGLALLERQCQKYLGMSAEEFVPLWDSGVIIDNDAYKHSDVIRCGMLVPFIRQGKNERN